MKRLPCLRFLKLHLLTNEAIYAEGVQQIIQGQGPGNT